MTDRITDEQLDNLLIAAAELAEVLETPLLFNTEWWERRTEVLALYRSGEAESDAP